MSCGNPHAVDCRDILARVYQYLDDELVDTDCAEVRQHLEECGPCLREYGLEESVKKLVAKHCGCDPVPEDLRSKVLTRLQQVQTEL